MQVSTKLEVIGLYIKVTSGEVQVNLELQLTEAFAMSNFEIASCKGFSQVELWNCMLLKSLGVTEN